MNKKYLKDILLLIFTAIISQNLYSQGIDIVDKVDGTVVLPTYHNIKLALTDFNFANNIKAKYGYTEDNGFLVAKTDRSYYGIMISPGKVRFRCSPDKNFFSLAIKDYLQYISSSPKVYEDEEVLSYIFEKRSNGITLSIIIMIIPLGGDIIVTIREDE